MYKLRIYPKAAKELKKLSQLHKEAIINALQDIQEDPFVGKPLTRELTGRFAYKVGVYRIIYTVNRKDKVVQIITAGHRATIYSG